LCLKVLGGIEDAGRRERLAKRYAAQAMKLVRKLPEARRRALEKDNDFEALRGRPEWKE
jgi:hypothetical protein